MIQIEKLNVLLPSMIERAALPAFSPGAAHSLRSRVANGFQSDTLPKRELQRIAVRIGKEDKVANRLAIVLRRFS
ncbi:hypothetical protein D3C72_2305400 [compost metagenome]